MIKFLRNPTLTLIFLLLCAPFVANANSKNEDSIRTYLQSFHGDSNKINAYCDLSYRLTNSNPDQSLVVAKEGLLLAGKKNFLKQEAILLKNIGSVHFLKGEYEIAIDNARKSIKIAEQKGFFDVYTDAMNLSGNIYSFQGNYDSALYYYENAINIAEKNELTLAKAKAIMNTGIIYYYRGEYEKSLKYYFKSLHECNSINDSSLIAPILFQITNGYYVINQYEKALQYAFAVLPLATSNLDNILLANTYNSIGAIYAAQDKYDLAISYYYKSLEIKKNTDNRKGQISCLVNIAGCYHDQGQYAESLPFMEAALKLSEKLNDRSNIALSNMNIGNTYRMMGRKKKALDYFFKAEKILLYLGEKKRLEQLYLRVSDTYSEIEQPIKALKYYKLYSEVKDSVLNIGIHRQLAEMEAKYQGEKKQRKIANLAQENSEKELQLQTEKNISYRKTIALISVLGAGIVLMLITFALFRNYRAKKKREKEKILRDLENYAAEVEKLRTNIQTLLHKNPAPFKINISKDEINRYLIDPLTEREQEILNEIAQGKNNKFIAEALFVSENTVKFHLKNIFLKLDVKNRIEALAKAGAMNLLQSQ